MAFDTPLYPVNLAIADRRCLVVGGGTVATAKIEGLLECGARVHVIASAVASALQDRAAHDGSLTIEERPFRTDDIEGFQLVITATDQPAVNRQVAMAADARGIWVNSADDPSNCSFTLPARIRQGPLLVTFSTGGRSPAVATWLRRTYQEQFGSEYVTLIEMLSDERRTIRTSGQSTEGLNWQAALDSGMLDLIREGRLAEAKERLQACLSSSSD